tara:strand:+ start:11 stop:586 length:576 start_codon:yes stop_codon:yes gene_type:complete
MISSIKDKLNNISFDLPTGNRKAGVMILLTENTNKDFSIKFTLRSSKMETHAGEVSFPGGMMEEIDVDIFHTAIRECEEEINLERKNLKILGKMDYFISRHKVEVHPIIGFLESHQVFQANYEADEIFDVPISYLLDKKNIIWQKLERDGIKFKSPSWSYNGFKIWGLTAMITAIFVNDCFEAGIKLDWKR